MIHLYTWKTPNGRKVPILLEELGWEYEVHPIDIGHDAQFSDEFLAISPNNKIPAMVDDGAVGGPLSIVESGAILSYIAEKSGRYLGGTGPGRWKVQEWLHWQIGSLGPMLGQLGFYAVRSKEKAPLAIQRFTQEAERLLGVMEKQLSQHPFLAGDSYSIADIAAYPWTMAATTTMKDPLAEVLGRTPAIHRWLETMGARPAVQRGMRVLEG